MKTSFVILLLSLSLFLNLAAAALDFGGVPPKGDLTFTGNDVNDYFGYTVSSGGDINKDGFDDIVIGAYRKENGRGAVYVIYGGEAINPLDLSLTNLDSLTTGFTIRGDQDNDLFGYAINSDGDINNDGYKDIIIGAFRKDSYTGAVYVIYGGEKSSLVDRDLSLLNMALEPHTTGFTITGDSTSDNFGNAVSTGDVDNDGFDDIIIGAYGKNSGEGQAYVIYGGPKLTMSNIDISNGLNPTKGFVIVGAGTTGDSFGYSVSTGKVNGDNYDDIVIGAPDQDNHAGAVYVIYGRERSDFPNPVQITALDFATTGLKVTGETDSMSGYSVATADVTGDGVDDIIVGAYMKNAVFVIYGQSTFAGDLWLGMILLLPASNGFTIRGSGTSSDWFGSSVNNAGDINQDGYEDIIIGAPYKDSDQGAFYIVYGEDKLAASDVDFSVFGPPDKGFLVLGNPGSQLGMSVCSGDINSDGFSDVIIGAPGGTLMAGAAYVLFYNLCSANCDTCTSPSTCNECSQGYGLQGSTCSPCPPNCQECSSVSISVCDLCSESYFLEKPLGTCVSTCPQMTVGLNRVCEDCPASCLSCSDTTFCNTCSSGSYLYQGGCQASCPPKTIIQGQACKDCPAGCDSCSSETVCTDCEEDSMLYNGQCFSVCPSGTFTSGDACQDCSINCDRCSSFASCNACSGGYLLDNGQCVPSCPIGKFGSEGVCQSCLPKCGRCSNSTVCEVCSQYYFLYQGQCIGSCPSKTFTSGATCLDCGETCSECGDASTCQACLPGYTLTGSHLCVLETEEFEEKDGEKAAAGVFEGTSLIGASLSSGSSLPLNFGLVAKILRNFKYMDIPVSRELQETFISWRVASGFMSAPKSWRLKYNSKELPRVFSRYGLQSAFLINFWKPFSMALIGAALFGVFKVIEVFMSKKKSTIYSISRQVNIAASNFALTQFYSNLDDVIFYFVIEARSMEFDTGFRVFSLIFAVVILMAGGLLAGLHIKFVGKYQNLKGEKVSPQLEAFVAKSENVNLIFKDFKDTTSFTQSFLLINVIRSMISSFIFAVFYQHPVIQIFLLFVLNMIMLAYLLVRKPFKEISSTCGQIFCEVILLIANISVFILVMFDQSDSYPIDSVERLSKCIIVLNFILLFGCVLLMLVTIGKMLYQSYQEKKRAKVVESRPDSSEIFTSVKFSRPAGLAQSDQNLRQSAATDVQNNTEAYRNALETSILRNNNSQSNLGLSANYYFPNQANTNIENNEMSSSNIIFQPSQTEGLVETSQVNLLSNNTLSSSPQIRSHPRPKIQVAQDFRLDDNSSFEGFESKVLDPSFHSRMVLNQEMEGNQDISLTNYEQEQVGESSPPLRAEIEGSPNLAPRRKIRKNEDMIFRGIRK